MRKYSTYFLALMALPTAATLVAWFQLARLNAPAWVCYVGVSAVLADFLVEGWTRCRRFFQANAGKQILAKDLAKLLGWHAIRTSVPFVVAGLVYAAVPRLIPDGTVAPLLPELEAEPDSLSWNEVRATWIVSLRWYAAHWRPEVQFGLAVVAWLIVTTFRHSEDESYEGHIRGRRLVGLEEAAKRADSERPKKDPGIPWGGVLLPSNVAPLHFLAIGAPGSGKTLTQELVMQRALRRRERALVNDPKSDMLSLLAGMRVEFKTMNPFDTRGVAWNMAKDIATELSAESVSAILCPPNKQAKEPFFDDAARALMKGAILALNARNAGAWSFRDLIYGLRSRQRLVQLLDATAEGCDLIDLYFSEDKTANNVMSTVANKTDPYRTIAAAWYHAKEQISLSDWMERGYVLVLGSSHIARPALVAVNRVLFKRVSQLLLEQSQQKARPTWIFLDELRQAGKLDGLDELAVEARSRSVSLVLGTQDVEGLQAVYGEKEANELIGMCAHKAILRLESPETARWASQLFGESEAFELRRSITSGPGGDSDGMNEDIVKRDVLMPGEFMSLPPTNPTNGLSGFYMSPGVGAWWSVLSGRELKRQLVRRDQSVPNFIARPDDELRLAPWTSDDLARLGLVPTAEPEADDTNVVELEPRRRRKLKAEDLQRPPWGRQA